MRVLLIATLDTKGRELAFVRDRLMEHGMGAWVLDAGVLGPPAFPPDIPREEVFRAVGNTWEAVRDRGDRGEAVTLAARGVETIARRLFQEGQIQGVLGLGGSAGTTIATAAMRALPLGVPKLMVSTLASGQVRPFVGPRDLLMLHSVTDISGVNRISRRVLGNAAAAMAGMLRWPVSNVEEDKPLVTATMFGVTTPCVEMSRGPIEAAGFEVLVFHAVGTGGEAMESLIGDGWIAGVLDVTTTELADELVGGILSAGPDRLTAAGRRGVPQVVSVGALDMVNFGPRASVPARFEGRRFYVHNENVTLMRTTVEENRQLGALLAKKLSAAEGPTAVVLPLGGVSAMDAPGKPFWDPEADAALFGAIRQHLSPRVSLIESPCHINDADFAALLADTLLALLRK